MNPDALHMVADARGVPRGERSYCAVCGSSPFPMGRLAVDVVTPMFSDREWIADERAEHVCAGCVSLLSGRPGDDPPPLRTMHVLARPGEPLHNLTPAQLGDAILNPFDGDHVLVWATSRQRQAVLRAGISRPGRLLVGADDGTIEVLPQHKEAAHAVGRLVAGFRRDAVRAGQYAANAIAEYGAARWRADEAIVSEIRGTLLLDLFCATMPKDETQHEKEEAMLQPCDQDAVEVLSKLALASDMRTNDGLSFWRAAYLHRIRRYANQPMADFIAKVGAAIGVRPCAPSMAELVAWIASLPESRVASISAAIRERATLLVASAYLNVRSTK